ncbi:MAG TPA: AMP-binding protein [Tianweitania sediminis]|nr:AMP-binding protein [Tianweitania sediminis]
MTKPGYPAISLAEAHRRLCAPGSEFEMDEIIIRGQPTRVWKNAPPTLHDLLLIGRSFGEKTFLVHEEERVTFEAFARASIVLSHHFVDLGVEKGDRIAVVMRNMPEWITVFFAAQLCGALAVPLNAWWSSSELLHGLSDSGAKLVVCDGERLERILEAANEIPQAIDILVARGGEASRGSARALESVIGTPETWHALPDEAMPTVPLAPEDPATIFYTSGTTGRPKGAVNTHRNLCSNVMAHPFSQARSFLRRGDAIPVPPPNAPQKVSLLSIPLFHVTGCSATMLTALHRGTRLVLTRRFDEEEALGLIERERVTTIGGVPTVAWRILDHPARSRYDLSSLQVVSYGGAPAAAELVRRLEAELPMGLGVATGWGMTETTATFTHVMGEDYYAHPTSCGLPLPVCEVRIRDADATVGPNTVGELQVRGPMVIPGYWNKPDADAATFDDGWLRTGDLAFLDEDGFVYIRDRLKDMIIRGGENIYCVEVEDALYAHPDVVDAALLALPHPTLGEEPGAVVVLREGATAGHEELNAFLTPRIAAFKRPVRYLILDEMPRNPAGKILKPQLRQLFAETLRRNEPA